MGVVLHSLEALPGQGRYAAVFRYPNGTSQTAVVHTDGHWIDAAEASLPKGWSIGSPEFEALAEAVLAFQRARALAPAAAELRDVDGGWDVSLGNVVLGPGNVPTCTAHGPMAVDRGDRFECLEAGCGAVASYAVG